LKIGPQDFFYPGYIQCRRKPKWGPRTAEIFPQFSDDLFSPHLRQVYLYEPLYPLGYWPLTLSDVTPPPPLHRHLMPFTTNGAPLPHDGAILPPCPSAVGGLGGGLRRLWLYMLTILYCCTCNRRLDITQPGVTGQRNSAVRTASFSNQHHSFEEALPSHMGHCD